MAGTWAGVVRVSHMGTRRAGAEDFHSERDQIKAMQRAVTNRGGTLDLLPSELDVSGGLPLAERPSLRAAVEGVEQGRYVGIIVAYQSRLSRNVEEEEAIWRRVEQADGQILLALDPVDNSTVDGRMFRRIRGAFNAGERERHSERFAELRRDATAAGIWQRRQTPRGYDRDPQTRKLVPNGEADLVRVQIFGARAAGMPLVQIAETIGMTPSGVRALLRNRVYLGELHVGDAVNLAAHPAIIDEDLFLAVQGKVTTRPARSGGAPALLGGLVRCCGCGHVMSRGKTKAVVYTCHGRSSAGPCPAPAAVTLARLDELVERVALAELARLRTAASRDDRAITDARRALKLAERELAVYLEAVSAADVGAEAFQAGARRRRQDADAARGEVARQLAARPAVVDGDPVGLWEKSGGEQRNRLLRRLVECVLVERSGGRGVIRPLEDRVRVIAYGAGLVEPHRGGGVAAGVRGIVLPEADDPRVLRV